MTGAPISEITGQPADTWSEAWRHECECRHVLDGMNTREQRNLWLYGKPDGSRPPAGEDYPRGCVARIRGVDAADRIKAGVLAIINFRKSRTDASS